MKKIVIYARFSSENQREESIDAQLRACRDYARSHKYLVVGEYVERSRGRILGGDYEESSSVCTI